LTLLCAVVKSLFVEINLVTSDFKLDRSYLNVERILVSSVRLYVLSFLSISVYNLLDVDSSPYMMILPIGILGILVWLK
jgi:hypothetical protein